MCVGGALAILAFVTVQVVYVMRYGTEGDSVRMNVRYQQPMLLSSALVVASIGDFILFAMLARTITEWWRSRKSGDR
jgi:hypothetical protein